MKLFLDVLLKILGLAWKFLKIPLAVVAIGIGLLILSYIYHYLYLRYKEKIEPQSTVGKRYKVVDIFIVKKLWIALKQMAKDRLTRDPSEFIPEDGRIIVFCGMQGQGKTISMTYLLNKYKAGWPLLKTATNYGYVYQDAEINHWRDMINLENGKQGYILGIDEAQVYWNSRDYKNFDVSMLQEITTQRKQSKMIMMSAQSFHFLDKNIRCQVHEIHQCMTLGRCFTIVIVRRPIMTYDGEVEKLKFRRIYCFNHDEKLRNSYDTYRVVEALEKKGFVPRSEQLGKIADKQDTNIVIDKKTIKKLK